jgi:hypothetical protein
MRSIPAADEAEGAGAKEMGRREQQGHRHDGGPILSSSIRKDVISLSGDAAPRNAPSIPLYSPSKIPVISA